MTGKITAIAFTVMMTSWFFFFSISAPPADANGSAGVESAPTVAGADLTFQTGVWTIPEEVNLVPDYNFENGKLHWSNQFGGEECAINTTNANYYRGTGSMRMAAFSQSVARWNSISSNRHISPGSVYSMGAWIKVQKAAENSEAAFIVRAVTTDGQGTQIGEVRDKNLYPAPGDWKHLTDELVTGESLSYVERFELEVTGNVINTNSVTVYFDDLYLKTIAEVEGTGVLKLGAYNKKYGEEAERVVSGPVQVKAGGRYCASVDIKNHSETPNVRGSVELRFFNGNTLIDIMGGSTKEHYAGFTTIYVNAEAPKNATHVKIALISEGSGVTWFDNVLLTEDIPDIIVHGTPASLSELISGEGKISFTVKVNEYRVFTAIAALYNDENKLISMDIDDYDADSGAPGEVQLKLDISKIKGTGEGYRAKIILWENAKSAAPLIQPVNIFPSN